MKRILAVCVFVFFCAFCAAGAGMGAQPGPLQEQIRATYAGMRSFEADFEQTLTHKESGAVEKRKGRLSFQKPLLIRWQTEKPAPETLIVTGKEIWDYLPDEEIAYRYAPDIVGDSRNIIRVLTGQANLGKDFNVKAAGAVGNLQKLTLLPHEPAPQLVEATIWADPATGLIMRAAATDFYGNVNDISFSNFRRDAKIPPARFSFTPPKGVDVEDRVKKGLEERDLFQ